MRIQIEKILRETPGIKAKDIAKKLAVEKSDVNSFLYAHVDFFQKDENHCWSLRGSEQRIELAANCWVDCHSFEKTLAAVGSPLDSNAKSFVFVVPDDCKLLLEASARLMALLNQIAHSGRTVTIDFTQCYATLKFLDRIGFFDQLNEKVIVLPQRPETSAATIYKGNNNVLVEFGAIDPIHPDETIPKQLKESFVAQAGTKYSQAAFTVITELFGNVRDHSKSPLPGFVALQCYKNRKLPHIQTVISDSGIGIVGTLIPILERKYPKIFRELASSDSPPEKLLLKKVFTLGEISQSDEQGRGLGLKSSSDAASKFDATILVRQERCEARFSYRNGQLRTFEFDGDMPRIMGTHICFDFLLDPKA